MNSLSTSDRPIVGRCKFERELLGLQSQLLGFALKLTGHRERAEDLVHDTYAKALKAWESYIPGTNMKAWIFTIMRNVYYSERRRSWRDVELDQDFIERQPDTSSSQADHEEAVQAFCSIAPLLGFLPIEMRDSVVAVHFCGMQYDEVSKILDVGVGTIKSRVSRGLMLLRNVLSEQRKHPFDVSAWATATRSVPRNHLYFPIAKAYEEIYKLIMERPDMLPTGVKAHTRKPAEVEEAWCLLVDSGALDDVEYLEE